MTINLERVNSAPLYGTNKLEDDLKRWILTLVDSLNSTIGTIEASLNTIAPSFTQAEITAMSSTLSDGVILYDTTNNLYVGRQNGSMVKFTTAAWP